jgi:hypothetical protein
MHLKVFLKLKNPKNSLFWVKKVKKKQQQKKTLKKQKKTTGLGFFKNPGFFQPCLQEAADKSSADILARLEQERSSGAEVIALLRKLDTSSPKE